jgi:hypothetical protein
MSDPDPRVDVGLGQTVRLATDPSERAGCVVAIVLAAPMPGAREVPHRPS